MSSALPEAVHYHRWVLDLIWPHLGGRLLEVGFGYGQYTRQLAGMVGELVSVDIDPACLDIGPTLPENVRLAMADVSDPDFPRQVGPAGFDAAVCLNVLEHIEDDRQALGSLRASLEPGGRLLLLVPAHPALFGPMDRLAGHFRRYTRKMLAERLAQAELRVMMLRYVNPIGAIGWWCNARFHRPDSLSDPAINGQIRFFDKYVAPLSRLLTPCTSRLFGQSLWAVAARDEGPCAESAA